MLCCESLQWGKMGEKNIEVIKCDWAGSADGAAGGWSLQREEGGQDLGFEGPCHRVQHRF